MVDDMEDAVPEDDVWGQNLRSRISNGDEAASAVERCTDALTRRSRRTTGRD